MNIINRLTLRHLKENKRRTLVTIIGVIISVAMITAVTTIGVSFLDLFQRDHIANEGEWHVKYENVNAEQIEAIKKDKNTETLVLVNDRGYAQLEGSQNKRKPYLFIKEYSPKGFEKFPVTVVEGRLPQQENEIVISEEIISNAKVNYKLGDEIILDVGQIGMREGEEDQERFIYLETVAYKVVGIMERPKWEYPWSQSYTVLGFIDESKLASDDQVDAAVVLNKVKRSLYTEAQELAGQNGIESVSFNNALLRYYGVTSNDNLRKTINGLVGIILGITIIGSVALIYNSFAISVSERSRHLGMLSSVGATRIQKRNSVFFEGVVIGLISIPLGILGGLGGLGVTFFFINQGIIQGVLNTTEKLLVKVTPMSLILACVVSIFTIFISTYIPARRASRISAIDAIRQTADIKLKGKTVKTSKLVRMVFGIEAEIGLKNLKRNRGRYQATVFSIIISIVLFLTVSFFNDNLYKSVNLSQSGVNYDIDARMKSDKEIETELNEWLHERDEITKYVFLKDIYAKSWLEEEKVPKELREHLMSLDPIAKEGKYPYQLNIHSLNDEALKEYAEAVGADYTELLDPNKLAGIIINKITYRASETGKYVEINASEVEVGDKIDVLITVPGEELEERFVDQIEIVALAKERPLGVHSAGIGGLSIIVSEATLERLTSEENRLDPITSIFLNTSDPLATQQALEERQENFYYINNIKQARERETKTLLFISIFTYGFIALITIICIANIFNTISTSIALRRREFAMLKSVGMTPKGFNKMINYESIFYGLKALLYGLPISGIIMALIYRFYMYSFDYEFTLPWSSIIIAVAAVFIIVGSAMLYSGAKIKKENIIDALKQENI